MSSLLLAAGCGRTDLDRREVVLVDGGAASVGASPADAGLSDASTVPDGGAVLDAGADAETPPPPPPCPVAPVGSAVALVSFPDSPAGVPRLVALDDGASGGAARVAIGTLKENANTWHPEYRVARAEVLPAWPSGLSLDQPLVVWGVDSHAWAEMTSLPNGGLALLQNYGGELSAPVGVKLRPFDTTTWTPGPDTYVDQQGESPYGIAAGAGAGPMNVGYGGQGLGVAWRAHDGDALARPRVAVLSEAGSVLIGPFDAAEAEAYPGRSADIAWTGQTYVVAVSLAGGVAVRRIRPASGDYVDDSGLDDVAFVPVADAGASPGRPVLTRFGGHTYLGWLEGALADKDAIRALRFVALAGDGAPLGTPTLVASAPSVTSGVSLSAGPLGLFVSWTRTASGGDPHAPGHSVLEVHHHALDGALVQPPVTMAITQVSSFGKGTAVQLASPRGVLLAWSAESTKNGEQRPTWLGRFDCPAP